MTTLPQSKWTCPLFFIPMCSDNKSNEVMNKRLWNTATMISKEDQRSWLKIEFAWGHNVRQCYEELQKLRWTCITLPYNSKVGQSIQKKDDPPFRTLAQMVAYLPLVQQVRDSIPGRIFNFHLKIFNLGARRGGDVHFLIARLYITGLD